MPRTKRSKPVHLSKVRKPNVKDRKDNQITDIRELVEKFERVFIIALINQRNTALQALRAKLLPGRIFFGKSKIAQIALGQTPEEEIEDNLHKVAGRLHGQKALLFTNQTPEEVITIFKEFHPQEYARSGAIATKTVTLASGTESLAMFPHNMETQIRSLGLPTILKAGVIHLLGDHTVCEEGDILTPNAAHMLKLLDIKMSSFDALIELCWEKNDGSIKEYLLEADE